MSFSDVEEETEFFGEWIVELEAVVLPDLEVEAKALEVLPSLGIRREEQFCHIQVGLVRTGMVPVNGHLDQMVHESLSL